MIPKTISEDIEEPAGPPIGPPGGNSTELTMTNTISMIHAFDAYNFQKPRPTLEQGTIVKISNDIKNDDFNKMMMKSSTSNVTWTLQETIVTIIIILIIFILPATIKSLTIHHILGIIIAVDTCFCFQTLLLFVYKSKSLHRVAVLTKRIAGWSRMPVKLIYIYMIYCNIETLHEL